MANCSDNNDRHNNLAESDDRMFLNNQTFYDQDNTAKYITSSYKDSNQNNDLSKDGKKSDHIQITNQRETLTLQLLNFQYECTICYIKLRPQIPIWSCVNCFHIFHMDCIKKWHKTCLDGSDDVKWRCPTCQKEYSVPESDFVYNCFCGKMKNPDFKRGIPMHCCDDVCGKSNKNNPNCPHLCSIMCHPGPCPTCEASITSKCHCSKDTLTVQCVNSKKHLVCGKICEKTLNCSKHLCEKLCHPGKCESCTENFTQTCNCGKQSRSVVCGDTSSFSCDGICGNLLDCRNHTCNERCHVGSCRSCVLLPENVRFCHCGKLELVEILPTGNRTNCLEAIPTCGSICGKQLSTCSHNCTSLCHDGKCHPCELSSSVKCRCKKTTQTIKCSKIGNGILCSNKCKSKKSCGNHRCSETCCDVEVHVCELICRKQLSCKQHHCDRTCHPGRCPTCQNVSFDELYCTCGASVLLPPIACGQIPPVCDKVCTRQHSCSHEVLHNCHSEAECPPCVVLTTKSCPGGHKELFNIPCFRPVVTCGLPCGKQLPDCQHFCIKDCHLGPCTNGQFKCHQLCTLQRPNCQHPCNAPCHTGDCQDVMKPCTYKVDVRCNCNHKSSSFICHKLQLIKSSNMSNNLIVFDKDKSASLVCDSDCKKAARMKQNIEALESEIVSLDSVSYTGFLRDFSTSNPDFTIKIDADFVNTIRKLESNVLTKSLHRFEPMNRDKRRFIHELSKNFCVTSYSVGTEPKRFVTIEAVKGVCKIPNMRLSQFMQKNYPQLFKGPKQNQLKYPLAAKREPSNLILSHTNKTYPSGFSKHF